MPVISPDRHETIASKLEAQDHAAYLPPDTDPTVVAVRKCPLTPDYIVLTDVSRATKPR